MNQYSGIPYFANQEPGSDPFDLPITTDGGLPSINPVSSGIFRHTGSFLLNGSPVGGGVVPPVELEWSSNIVTDVSLGSTFDIYATGNFTIGNPSNPVDGKKVEWRIVATGSNVEVSVGSKFVKTSDSTIIFPYAITSETELIMMAEYKSRPDLWRIFAFVPNNPTSIEEEVVSYDPIWVHEAGTNEVNGTYDYANITNGKPRFDMGESGYKVLWNSEDSMWVITDDTLDYYFSTDDTETPDQVTTWQVGPDGTEPIAQVDLD